MAALFSIWPVFLDRIFSGVKTAELRAKTVRLQSGDTLWLYCTSPRASLEGCAKVENVLTESTQDMWALLNGRLGISRDEFGHYSKGKDCVTAILLEDVVKFERPLSLMKIRQVSPRFHPPQFYSRIIKDSKTSMLFHAHAETYGLQKVASCTRTNGEPSRT